MFSGFFARNWLGKSKINIHERKLKIKQVGVNTENAKNIVQIRYKVGGNA